MPDDTIPSAIALPDPPPPMLRPATTALYGCEALITITPGQPTVTIRFPVKCEVFRGIVKSFGFRWSYAGWLLTSPQRIADPEAFCAGLAHALLASGFVVRLTSPGAFAKLRDGEFDELSDRWILRSTQNAFMVYWPYGNERYYQLARALPGASYNSGCVIVPRESADTLMDFAEAHDFVMSAQAKALVNEYRADLERALILDIKPRHRPAKPKPPVDGIDVDLRDE